MKNLPIVVKFLSIMMLFGMFALGVAFYAGSNISQIDGNYSDLLASESKASLKLVRANRSFQASRAAIGDILLSASVAGNQAALKEFQSQVDAFVENMDLASSVLQDPDFAQLKEKGLQVLKGACEKTVVMGSAAVTDADNKEALQAYQSDCQPKFAEMTASLVAKVEKIIKGADEKSDALSASAQSTYWTTVLGVIGGLAAILVCGFFAIRLWVVTPIRALSATMAGLSYGDLSIEVNGTERRDEVGGMARAVQVFKDNGLKTRALEQQTENQRLVTEEERRRNAEVEGLRVQAMAQATLGLASGLKHLSDGDLSFQLSEPFAADFESLRADFNAAVSQLSETLGAVAQATAQIDSGTREISQSADDLSKRTEQQASSLEETAAALDQITTNVANSSKRADEARAVAIDASHSAIQSGKVVADAVNAMQKIEQSSTQISNIIGVIDEIAFQTNLLALNAGVEAARAGDAGKGFAVVAQEVRELAQRSAQAAKEIKELIRNSSVDVEGGVKLVRETGEALKAIEVHVVTINSHMEAIATSSREQSLGLAEVNTAVNQMDQVTQQNAAMVEESTAASATLAAEAERLRCLIEQFQLGCGQAAVSETRPRLVPVSVSHNHRPVSSPVRKMAGQLANAFSNAAHATESWQEF
ncbi:chemotaxis protein [Rhizobium sp. Leaf386]|nr:methyl-accepting chemotaxis protein [Rhizobium sp. Leaf386]KQT06823.1 chemotaxis protein [Rhizobium sp. Leaf386]